MLFCMWYRYVVYIGMFSTYFCIFPINSRRSPTKTAAPKGVFWCCWKYVYVWDGFYHSFRSRWLEAQCLLPLALKRGSDLGLGMVGKGVVSFYKMWYNALLRCISFTSVLKC